MLAADPATHYSATAEGVGGGVLAGSFSDGNAFERQFATESSSDVWKFKVAGTRLNFEIGYDGEGYGLLSQFGQKLPAFMLSIR